MGQKLDKVSPSLDEYSQQGGETQQPEIPGEDESRDQDQVSFTTPDGERSVISERVMATERQGDLAVTSAHPNLQTGQPIMPLGQPGHPQSSQRKGVGGESRIAPPTVEWSHAIMSSKGSRQTLDKNQVWGKSAAICVEATAMEEDTNQKERHADINSKSFLEANPPMNEEDFVVLEKDGTWTSSEMENCLIFDRKRKTKTQYQPYEGVSKERLNTCNAEVSHSLGNTPKEIQTSNQSTEKSDTRVIPTHASDAESSSSARFRREAGQVTGGSCQLKEVCNAGSSHRTSGETEAEIEQRRDDPCVDDARQQPRSHQNGLKEKTGKGVSIQQVDQSHVSRFAGAVSGRVKEELTKTPGDPQVADCHPLNTATPGHHDYSSFPLEQCEPLPDAHLNTNHAADGDLQVAGLKRESELVCFSAVVTAPPLEHQVPSRDSQKAADTDVRKIASDATTTVYDDSMLIEKPKVKGPPPPVPKKPKNPFIKIKTAQLMSTDVQRRSKNQSRSEEWVKRRHTFHFNKDLLGKPLGNQDMCALWDERGTYVMPANIRRLTVDLSPWDHLSLEDMNDQYGDMIDFNYCDRMSKVSPEEEVFDMDMLQRKVFLQRRSRYKSSPPPVAKKSQNHFVSVENPHVGEEMLGNEIHRPKPACSGVREAHPELQSERVSTQVCDEGFSSRRDTVLHTDSNDVGSYKPVSEIVKETNQMQRLSNRAIPDKPKARVAEQSSSLKVSQIKDAFDVPKKSKDRPADVQPPSKKGEYRRHTFSV